MLNLILNLAKLLKKEPCSIQREVITRVSKKRGLWDLDNKELIELYDHLNMLVKKRGGPGTLTPNQFFTLIQYPTSAVNFRNGKKVHINDIEAFRSLIEKQQG
jgi:hypothetical protein